VRALAAELRQQGVSRLTVDGLLKAADAAKPTGQTEQMASHKLQARAVELEGMLE
jgi:SOS response regulatory protein OraA/RecX